MNNASVRREIQIGPIRPPQRLAPFSYAIGAEVAHSGHGDAAVPEHSEGDAFGRLILLYDPQGDEAWDGTFRLVAYVQADLDEAVASDPLLPEVVWSWLTEALEARGAVMTALGGAVTATTSVRFGDIAGPDRGYQLELRASWTPKDESNEDMGLHVQAFCDLLANAAGLPPAGVTELGPRGRS